MWEDVLGDPCTRAVVALKEERLSETILSTPQGNPHPLHTMVRLALKRDVSTIVELVPNIRLRSMTEPRNMSVPAAE